MRRGSFFRKDVARAAAVDTSDCRRAARSGCGGIQCGARGGVARVITGGLVVRDPWGRRRPIRWAGGLGGLRWFLPGRMRRMLRRLFRRDGRGRVRLHCGERGCCASGNSGGGVGGSGIRDRRWRGRGGRRGSRCRAW